MAHQRFIVISMIILISTFAATSKGELLECPADDTFYNNHCYHVSKTKGAIIPSQCISPYYNIRVGNNAENSFIVRIAGGKTVLIAVQLIVTPFGSNWYWWNGAPLSWYPAGSTLGWSPAKSCGVQLPSGKWDHVDCYGQFYQVCEAKLVELTTAPPTTDVPTTSIGGSEDVTLTTGNNGSSSTVINTTAMESTTAFTTSNVVTHKGESVVTAISSKSSAVYSSISAKNTGITLAAPTSDQHLTSLDSGNDDTISSSMQSTPDGFSWIIGGGATDVPLLSDTSTTAIRSLLETTQSIPPTLAPTKAISPPMSATQTPTTTTPATMPATIPTTIPATTSATTSAAKLASPSKMSQSTDFQPATTAKVEQPFTADTIVDSSVPNAFSKSNISSHSVSSTTSLLNPRNIASTQTTVGDTITGTSSDTDILTIYSSVGHFFTTDHQSPTRGVTYDKLDKISKTTIIPYSYSGLISRTAPVAISDNVYTNKDNWHLIPMQEDTFIQWPILTPFSHTKSWSKVLDKHLKKCTRCNKFNRN